MNGAPERKPRQQTVRNRPRRHRRTACSQGGAGIERQADNYAADLLMPAYLFRPLAAAHRRPSFEAIDALAAAFSTSRLATAQRFIDHSPWPCMIVCHGQNGRRWFRRNGGIADHWFPRDDLDPESDAMDVLYGGTSRFVIWTAAVGTNGQQRPERCRKVY